MMSGIYAITNLINGKKYIGQSVDVEDRIKHHKADLRRRNHHNIHLQRAFNQYGEESFSFTIIQKCSIDDLDKNEIWWIKHFNTTHRDDGYNIEDGGNLFKTVSDETKRRISEANKNPSEETRRKIGEANFNPSKEIRRKISETSSKRNTTGIFRVFKENNERIHQGYQWCYSYTDRNTNNRKVLKSVSISDLKKKVIAKGLIWRILDEKLAKETLTTNTAKQKQNSTGFYRVSIFHDKQYSKGFAWRYIYKINGKMKVIKSVSIVKLEKMVKAKGLPWKITNEELAKRTIEQDNIKIESKKPKYQYSKLTTTGIFRVTKRKCRTCKYGFTWEYGWVENGKRKTITSTSLSKLEKKIKAKGLHWKIIDEELAKNAIKEDKK